MDTQQEQIKEEWRPVVGYEGKYEVSNLGNVDAINFHRQGIRMALKKVKLNNGYIRVTLYKNGKPKHHAVHRLVASAFIPNPNNYPCINHKDEDKANNAVSNLEWCTVSYNTNYGTSPRRVSEKNGIPVLQLTIDGKVIKRYHAMQEASRITGIHENNISRVCRGMTITASGYKWRYEDDELYQKSLQKRQDIVQQYTKMGHENRKGGKPILAYSKDGIFIKEFQSAMEASRALNLDGSSIIKVCKGKNKKHKGYVFVYKE